MTTGGQNGKRTRAIDGARFDVWNSEKQTGVEGRSPGKISLRGSGIFTPDELAQVVEQVQNWVQQLRQPAGMTSSPLQQMFPPLPADSHTVPMD